MARAVSLLIVLALTMGLGSPAYAQPTPSPSPTGPPLNEDGTPTLASLRANLESATAGYIEAENQLNAAKAKQVELEKQLQAAQVEISEVRAGVAQYASEAYKNGRLGVLGTMLNATSPDEFLSRAAALDKMTARDQQYLVRLRDATRTAAEAKAGIEIQIAEQTTATAEMAKRKLAAERALAAVGGGPTTPNVNTGGAATADPAPRNPDGSWPRESCSQNDPTPADGCLTPRTLHALNEAKDAGFTRFVSCFRPGGSGEHPKGRACDHSVFRNNDFVDKSAGGSDRDYGNRLAAFYIKNARALGVMYVVWYCQIWLVGSGWRRYNSTGSNCGDDSAGDHTNHVHVSIY